MFCYSGIALGPAIAYALLLAEVASRGTSILIIGFEVFFSKGMIFVASWPEGAAHFDPRAFSSAFWLAASLGPH